MLSLILSFLFADLGYFCIYLTCKPVIDRGCRWGKGRTIGGVDLLYVLPMYLAKCMDELFGGPLLHLLREGQRIDE